MIFWILRKLGIYTPYHKLILGASDHRFQEDCSICIEPLGIDRCYQLKKCKHIYHQGCIKDWRKQSSTCPLCRSVIVPSYLSDPITLQSN